MLAAVNDNAVHAEGVQIFAGGPNCCAVCAPITISKTVVEAEAGRGEPRGSILAWRAYAGPIDGNPHPRRCPHDARRQHWLLVRHLKR